MTPSTAIVDESTRLAVLDSYAILDTPSEKAFDDVVKLVSELLRAPIAAVNLIARERQWFKSEVGLGLREMPLDDSICRMALLEQHQLIVPDASQDERFSCNPLVAGAPGLRFYAGELLKTRDGIALGTLCVLDTAPRPHGLSEQEQFVLSTLAQQVMSQIELRKALKDQQALIEQQAAVEEALRESRQLALQIASQAESERRRLDALLDAAPVGIIMADAAGDVVTMNAQGRKLWGIEPTGSDAEQYQRRKGWWADGSARHGKPIAPAEWVLAEALNGAPAPRQVIEIESFDRRRTRRTIVNSGAPVRGDSGVIVGAVLAQMDITDRIEAEAALRRADQRKDEFVAMLAHELRNPLAPITSAAAMLSRFDADRATVRRTSEIIARQANHMTGLIDDLLDVARVTRGKVDLGTVEMDMKGVIADAIEQVRPLIQKHDHRLVLQFASGPANVVGDRKRLVQVMTNLISNAAKYTPAGGKIEVALAADDVHVTMSVRDNGIGMTPELIASAFDLFAQGTRGLDRSQGGLGIGLALVKSLVELHGGAVEADSAGPGQGSILRVTLPRMASKTTDDPLAAESAEQRARGVDGALRIALVDDNEDAAITLAMLLETLGHEVKVVHSARDALGTFPGFAPDVCLLDIGLPEMNGYELARALRAQAGTAQATLIAVTGYAQEKDRVDAFAAGFHDLFAKPVELEVLSAALARIATGQAVR